MAVAGRGSAIIAACRKCVANAAQTRSKRCANVFQVAVTRNALLLGEVLSRGRRSTFARDYETFINVDDDTYRRDSRVARLVIRYFRFVTFVTRALPARFT